MKPDQWLVLTLAVALLFAVLEVSSSLP